MCAGHFCFQCSHTYDESLASFYSNDANREVIEYVLYEGAHDEFLQMEYKTWQYIVEYCQGHLSENALVIKSKEQCRFVVPENNHLQESQDEKEEHKGKVDKEGYIMNNMFINDASLSSNDSYYAQMNDNCSEEALCLDTNFGSVNIDELEIEPCHTNMQGQEWYDNSSKDEPVIGGDELEKEDTFPLSPAECYEVFPYDGSQGNVLQVIYKSLTFSL